MNEPPGDFRARLRAWLAGHKPPTTAAPTVAARFQELHAWQRVLHGGGWLGLDWPPEFGGAGLDASYQLILSEELRRAGAPWVADWVGLELVAPTLLRWGTTAQKQAHLPAILAGREIWCQGFSEENAGSDLAAVTTQGGDTINGRKRWTSWAHLATHCLVLARTRETRHKGLTCYIVPLDQPGITTTPIPMLYGDAEECDVTFDDVPVSADDVVGEIGGGWQVVMTSLTHARGTATLSRITTLQQTFDTLVEEHGTRSLRDHDTYTIARLARLQAELQGLRHLAYRKIGEMVEQGAPGHVASTEKLLWARLNAQITELGLELQGLPGAWSDGPLLPERGWRREFYRALAGRIEGGTDEIQRTVIARHVLGLPC